MTDQLPRVVQAARSIDIRAFEGAPACSIARELLPRVIDVTTDAIAVCSRTLAEHEPSDDEGGGEGSVPSIGAESFDVSHSVMVELDQRVVDDDDEKVAGLAFVGRAILVPKRQQLERMESDTDPWMMIGESGSARRRIVKALTALEVGLAQSERRAPRISFESELSRSLEVRRQYTRLRTTIGGGELEPRELPAWMRRVGTAFAMLIGQDVYPELRIDDRRQLRTLQSRLLDWLRLVDPAEASSVQEGLRLRQDIIGFAQMLGAVRNRQELIERDAIVLSELLEADPLPDDAIAQLRQLEGMDEELDRAIREGAERQVWLPLVARLHAALSGGGRFH